MSAPQALRPAAMGVVIVAFNSASVIGACLRSLLCSTGVALHVVVVDNASTDQTCQTVQDIAGEFAASYSFHESSGGAPAAPYASGPQGSLTLLASSQNGGYAHGVNAGLRALLPRPDVDLFWILNPDCEVPPATARTYWQAGKDDNFSLMGGRTVYLHRPDLIQTDGGRVSRWTGVCRSVHQGASAANTPLPAASELDFITGANCVASRRFITSAGPMTEDYFLYYEEVDWALRRGSLPLRIVPEAVVLHHGGTAIGSGSFERRASAFANYLNYRSRMLFLSRFAPMALPLARAYALAKAGQLTMLGHKSEAWAIVCAIFRWAPSAQVRSRLPFDLP